MRTQPASLLSHRVVVAVTGALIAVVAAGALPPPVRGALGAGPAALPRLGVSMGSPSSVQAKSSSSPDSQETQLGKQHQQRRVQGDRKSTRLNSSHVRISYAVFCLKKKKKKA